MFGFGPKLNTAELLARGALVVDVRSPMEFASGNYTGSINIPLETVTAQVAELKAKGKPLIVVCRSGARSAMAVSVLTSQGIEAYNGGAWNSI